MAKPQSSEVLYITMALIGLLAVCVFVIAGLVLVVAKRRREAGAFYASRPTGHFGTARSVRLSVPWRSCLGYRRASCLQLNHRRPLEMCGLRTRPPRTDVDPPRFLDRTAIGGLHIVSRPSGRYLVSGIFDKAF